MAQLAQVRLVLDLHDLSDERIVALGRLADEIAGQVAADIYGGDVDVDVLIQDGSLLTRITVVGGLLLGLYHGVAEYPDFKVGITALCEDAEKYSNKFADKFLHASGISEDHVVKHNTSAKTPGKINRLLNRLEKTAGKPTSSIIGSELSKAKKDLDSIERDITASEAEHLRTLFEFDTLPPVEHWSSAPVVVLPRAKSAPQHTRARVRTRRKPRTRYHNTFHVPPKR